jgi:tetratricopeptide (TPR) repeat protein
VTELEINLSKAQELLGQESPPLVELRKTLLEIEELINSTDYTSLTEEDQEALQLSRRDLKARIRQIEDINSLDVESENEQPPDLTDKQIDLVESDQPVQKTREPQAIQQMEEAESLFYGGRYAEAIRLFDRVLQVEPGWERARQHRTESENYLRTGYIPPVALPPDAASAFGKAQSAARVGRFNDALNFLSKAQSVLRELGIQRWQEGLEFEQKLQENIDAEYAYNEGLQLFEEGKIEEAIERVDTAFRATGLPKYNDKTQTFRSVKESIRSINESLSSTNIDPKMVTQAKSDLDLLTGEYGDNPAFHRLKARMDTTLPRAISPLQDQARALKAQAERSVTLDESLYLARQAKLQLDQIRNLSGMDDSLDHLQSDIEKLILQIVRNQDELNQAFAAYETNRRWPIRAVRISHEVRQNYPNDPDVIRLNRSLGGFFLISNLLKLGAILLGIAILAMLGYLAFGRFRAYLIALTPSPTPTVTLTPTSTPTQTPMPSSTPTPSPTPTFTPTSTPFLGAALRDVWARSGCYEGFNAIGRIPTGGNLRFLPEDRRFDTFNRECVLVEYQGENRSIIGWVLLADIGSRPASPSP